MSKTVKCENCMWYDRCQDSEACECYEPLSSEEQETIDIAEYKSDLHMRHRYYQEQISEQNR